MATTGRGNFPLQTSWPLRRRKGSLTPFVKSVWSDFDKDNTEVTLFNDWFFEASGAANYQLTAIGGTYTLSGGSAVLQRSKLLVASGGSYTVTGQTANINRNRRLTSNGGSYTYTGSSVSINKNRILLASGGSYVVAGQSAVITYTPNAVGYTLVAQGGNYTLTGASAVLLRSKLLTAQGGSYTYTGSNAVIKRDRKLVASGGLYSFTGSSAILTKLGMTWPDPSVVVAGTYYGPTGTEYVGTLDVMGIKYDITTGALVKPINDKVVMSL